jgi:hypothetical protein
MISTPGTMVPAYKDRRGWLTVFGVVEFLIAAALLLLAVITANNVPQASAPGGHPAGSLGQFLLNAGFDVILAALFITVGIGSILAQNWARIAMIAISSIWMAFGIVLTIFKTVGLTKFLRQQEALSRQSHADATNGNIAGMVMYVFLAFQAAMMIVLPLVLLLFYAGKNVKATCQNAGVPPVS